MKWLLILAVGVILGLILSRKRKGNLISEQTEQKSENKRKILERLSNKFTNTDVENLLSVSDATATRYLDELEKEGKVKQVGKTGKHVYYEKS